MNLYNISGLLYRGKICVAYILTLFFINLKINSFQNSRKYIIIAEYAIFLGYGHLNITNVLCNVEARAKESELYGVLEYNVKFYKFWQDDNV